MSLLEKTFAKEAALYARKIEALRLAAGAIHELESLVDAIKAAMPDSLGVSPIVTVHDSGSIVLRIFVHENHSAFRQAIIDCDLQVLCEIEADPGIHGANHRCSILHFVGIDENIYVQIHDEPMPMAVAA